MGNIVSSIDIKNGSYYIWDNTLYLCQNIELNKTAMAKMKVKVKSKNVRTGAITDVSLIGSDKVEIVFLDKRRMGFSYDDGNDIVFMDNETYEQLFISKEQLGNDVKFLVYGVDVEVLSFNGEILGVNLPPKVTLEVVESPDAVRGDTSKQALKDAVLETGLMIKVPLFVNEGDKVIVTTDTCEYVSRA